MRVVNIINQTRPLSLPLVADYCESFLCKLRGLSFRLHLPAARGLVLVDKAESRVNAAVHMVGMNFDLGIVWLDRDLVVVDLGLARRWRSILAPSEPAQYVIEFAALRLQEFAPGDQIAFEEIS